MTELVTVIVIVGILAAVVAPRFFNLGDFSSRGFYDQAVSTIRYAQKAAIAQRRFVCVAIAGGNTIALTQGANNACGGNLINPATGANYVVTAPTGVVISNTAFSFNGLGQPSAAQNITVSGYAAAIVVNAETGYVQ